MALEKIHINNFKSLVDLTIEKPNPFTVFVGPNASGKSNIFESLDFYSYLSRIEFYQLVSLFNGIDSIFNRKGNIRYIAAICKRSTRVIRHGYLQRFP